MDSLAALQDTGGTTGVAKGARLTHGNLLASIEQCLQAWRPWLRTGEEVMLTALPLYHIFAFTANLMLFFVTGGRDILIPSPRPLTNLRKVIEAEPVTWFTGVNTLFAGLMHESWFVQRASYTFRGSVAGGMALVPRGGRTLGAGDAHADLSGLRPHRDLAGGHAQPVPPGEARLDWCSSAWHRRPHRGR